MSSDEQKNYYEILGVKRDASKEEIKTAYKELALVYHPDSNFFDEIIGAGVDPADELIFKRITAAYQTLNNEAKRREYDETLSPELPSWSKKTQERMNEKLRERKNTSKGIHQGTFGRFGVVEDRGEGRENEEESAPEADEVFSVADQFRTGTQGGKNSLLGKLKNLFSKE